MHSHHTESAPLSSDHREGQRELQANEETLKAQIYFLGALGLNSDEPVSQWVKQNAVLFREIFEDSDVLRGLYRSNKDQFVAQMQERLTRVHLGKDQSETQPKAPPETLH